MTWIAPWMILVLNSFCIGLFKVICLVIYFIIYENCSPEKKAIGNHLIEIDVKIDSLVIYLILPPKTATWVKPLSSGHTTPAHSEQALSSHWLNVSFSGYNKLQYT